MQLACCWLSSKLRGCDSRAGPSNRIRHDKSVRSIKPRRGKRVSDCECLPLRMTPARFEHVSKPLHIDESQKPSASTRQGVNCGCESFRGGGYIQSHGPPHVPSHSHNGQLSGVVLVLGGVARISPSDADLTVREGFTTFRWPG